MASFKNRQPSDTNQSVPETDSVPETHSYQEKHFQPTVNEPVTESTQYTETGATVRPDPIQTRADRTTRSDVMETSDQPGEDEQLNTERIRQELQGNSDPGTQYSTPDVSSGVSSGSAGNATVYGGTGTAAATTASASTAATAASAAVAATGAILIAVTLVLPLVVGVPSAIIFDDIVVTDSSVYYSIYFEDYEEGMELYVSLHNNFTNRMHTVDSESISVVERDLKPNMEYTITVYGSMSSILEERTVKTMKSISEPVLTVNYADYIPEKGVVSLSAILSGDTEDWNDYRAVLYEEEKDVGKKMEISSIMLETVDADQELRFELESDRAYDTTFAIECKGPDGVVELYSQPMTVYGMPYFGYDVSFSQSDDTLRVDRTIYDPDGLRTEYWAILTVTNASNGESYTDSADIMDGGYTFQNVSHGYTFYYAELMFQCQQESHYRDLGFYDFRSYVSPQIGNIHTDWVPNDDVSVGATAGNYGTLTVTFDMVDDSNEWTDLVATLGDKQTTGYVLDKPFSNTDRTITFEIDQSERGSAPMLTFTNNGVSIYDKEIGPIPLYGGNPEFTYGGYTQLDPTGSLGAGINVTYSVKDIDNVWTDTTYTITQGDVSVSGSFSKDSTNWNLVLENEPFVNGSAILSMTCTQTLYGQQPQTGYELYNGSVNLFVGPTMSLTNGEYEPSQGKYVAVFDIDDPFGQWTSKTATLTSNTSVAGGYPASTGTFDSSTGTFTFEVDSVEGLRGKFATLTVKDGNITIFSKDDVDLHGYDSDISIEDSSADGPYSISVDLTFYDPDGDYSDFTYTVSQSSTGASYSGGSFTPVNGINTFTFSDGPGNKKFVNGYGSLTISFVSQSSGPSITGLDSVEIYVGPTVSVGSYSYSNGTATVAISISDRFDQWTGLQARLTVDSGAAAGMYVESTEVDFDKSQTSVTFIIDPVNGSDLLNIPLRFSLFQSSSQVYESADTITLLYSYVEGSTTEILDPSTSGRGIALSFTVSDPLSQWSTYSATVIQGTTTLCQNVSVTPGATANALSFGNAAFDNGIAHLTVVANANSGSPVTIIDEDTEVYYGPTVSVISSSYNGDTVSGTITLALEVEDSLGLATKVKLSNGDRSAGSGSTGYVYADQSVASGRSEYSFAVTGTDFLNRELTVDLVNDSDVSYVASVATVTVDYSYISSVSSSPLDPYGTDGRGLSITVTGSGIEGKTLTATVSQEISSRMIELGTNTQVTAGTPAIISLAGTYENGAAAISFSDSDGTPIPFEGGSTSMTVQVYYAPIITNATGGDYNGSGTVSSTITVDDMFGNFTGRYVQLYYMDPADKQVYTVRSAAFDGQGTTFTATFTLPTDDTVAFFLNTDMDVMFVNDSGELVGEPFGGTIRYRYVHLNDWAAEPKDLSVYGMPGETLDLEFAPGSDPDLYTNMHLTVTQGQVTLFDEAWAPGGDIEFYTRNFTNGAARMVLTCDDTFEGITGKTLINADVAVYGGPTIDGVTASYDVQRQIGTLNLTVTDTYNQLNNKSGRVYLTSAGISQTSIAGFDGSSLTFNIAKDSSAVNRDLSFEFMNDEGGSFLSYAGTVRFQYVEMTNHNVDMLNPSVNTGESLTLTRAGDSSLYTQYHARVYQDVTGVTIFDGDITLSPGTSEGIFTSDIKFESGGFGDGDASLTLTCMDVTSGRTVTLIDNESIEVYTGPYFNNVTAAYDVNQGIGTLTLDYVDHFGAWDGYYGSVDYYSGSTHTPIRSNAQLNGGTTLEFAIPQSSPMLNTDLKLSLVDSQGSTKVVCGDVITFVSPSVTGISASYDASQQIGTVTFTISDPGNDWSGNDLYVSLSGGNTLESEHNLSVQSTSVTFTIPTDSEHLNDPKIFELYRDGGKTPLFTAQDTIMFVHPRFQSLDCTALDDSVNPTTYGILATLNVQDPENYYHHYNITIVQDRVQLCSRIVSAGQTEIEFDRTPLSNNDGVVTITGYVSEDDDTGVQLYSDDITIYKGLEFSVNSALGRIDESTGNAIGTINYYIESNGKEELLIEITGDRLQSMSDPLVTWGTSTAEIILLDESSFNTEFTLKVIDSTYANPYHEETVIFKYATFSVTNTSVTDPSQSRGITVNAASNDTYGIRNMYHAKVLAPDGTTVLYDADLDDNEVNAGTFTLDFNGNAFVNGDGTLIITCTEAGVSEKEVYRGSVEVYYGPMVTFGSPLEIGEGGSAGTNEFNQYALFGEFGSNGADLTVVVLLDGYEEEECPEGYGYVGNTHLEFTVDGFNVPLGEEIPVVVYAISPDDYSRTEVARGTIVFVDEVQD